LTKIADVESAKAAKNKIMYRKLRLMDVSELTPAISLAEQILGIFILP
jgi:hypothetical protein